LSAYADTSFLVSLYTPDANSVEASARMRALNSPLWLTAFGELELANAIEFRLFRRELTASNVKAAHAAIREDIEGGVFSPKPLPMAVFETARRIVRTHTARLGTRTLDVLHVASALILGATEFYTFDQNHRKLALLEGLKTP
jgi:predicted nucleic acid-binding protein